MLIFGLLSLRSYDFQLRIPRISEQEYKAGQGLEVQIDEAEAYR